MPLIDPIIRPPAEADSLLLQITAGCSANTCSFCGAYKRKPFRLIDPSIIYDDIRKAAKLYPLTRKIFLLDGDALVLSNNKLIPILEQINQSFPHISRISSYANGHNISQKTQENLKELADHKLTLIYMGLESGSQKVLDNCGKKSSASEMIEAVNRATEVGIKTSAIVLLGLGGKENSAEHVAATSSALNKMQPRYLSFLSLMLIKGTPLYEQTRTGKFTELDSTELLQESYDIIKNLELTKTIFRSNHASNYLALEGRFPKDKSTLLQTLSAALNHQLPLRPEFFRAL